LQETKNELQTEINKSNREPWNHPADNNLLIIA
jgi:hypothetical protein